MSSIKSLLTFQDIVLESLKIENNKFTESRQELDLEEAIEEARRYQVKLRKIKKDMESIQDRTNLMKAKAHRLHKQKQAQAMDMELRRDRMKEQEKKLSPVVRSPTQPSSSRNPDPL